MYLALFLVLNMGMIFNPQEKKKKTQQDWWCYEMKQTQMLK